MIIHAVYLTIIIILLMTIGVLIDTLNEEVERNRRHFRNLRQDYDLRIKKLQDENDRMLGFRRDF